MLHKVFRLPKPTFLMGLTQAAEEFVKKRNTAVVIKATGLDPAIQEDLIGTIAALPGPCRAVVMVTHDIDHLPASCNRVLLLKGGRPLAEGAPSDVLTEERLSALYDCRMGVERREGRFIALRLGNREGAA